MIYHIPKTLSRKVRIAAEIEQAGIQHGKVEERVRGIQEPDWAPER